MENSQTSLAHSDKKEAAERLANSFNCISASWISDLAEHRGHSLPLPMWGWLWIAGGDQVPVNMIRELLIEIEPVDEEYEAFAAAGWEALGETGIMAIEFDRELLLGIHGAGYDFFEAHWIPLVESLDLM